MIRLFETCRAWPLGMDVLDELRTMPEWQEACLNGWLTERGELTATGRRQLGGRARGTIADRDF
jgi:hypothetical protein